MELTLHTQIADNLHLIVLVVENPVLIKLVGEIPDDTGSYHHPMIDDTFQPPHMAAIVPFSMENQPRSTVFGSLDKLHEEVQLVASAMVRVLPRLIG